MNNAPSRSAFRAPSIRRVTLRGLSALIALALAFAACDGGGGGGTGAPVQVGDNLSNNAVNNTVTCSNGFPIQGLGQPVFYLAGAQSCLINTWFPGAQPPASGTVVSANIAVGNATGPMRFVKMRALLKHPEGLTCCSVEAYGPIFTPTPNAVTTVALNFAMTEDHVPADLDFTTIAATDLVGLEVLAPNVPIPGMWTNFVGGDFTLPTYEYLPSFTERNLAAPTQNLRSEGSFSGFLPAYNLNFAAGAASGASPTAP